MTQIFPSTKRSVWALSPASPIISSVFGSSAGAYAKSNDLSSVAVAVRAVVGGALLFLLAVSLIFLAAGQASAQTHGAHEHGAAVLNVSIEDGGFEAELNGALAGFLSFEHKPATEDQRNEVKDMASRLGRAEELFKTPPAAGCKVEAIYLQSENIEPALLAPYDTPLEGHDHDGEEAGHDHDHDGKEVGHGHDGDEAEHDHDGEEAGHDHGGEEEHSHSDLEAFYEFSCADTKALTQITVDVFNLFPGLNEVEAQVISPSGQSAAELTAKENILKW
ncbi:MAG: DUF2796 domain-containing protein [Deltaproteobacteria bacterium]|jgi:hypothetical protein|nr:DUF2796 domain-containing protein [Deltaproteobacteria bacterium]